MTMKSMSCTQLGGACNLEFFGNDFEELASQSQKHGKEMFEANDSDHLEAMGKMMALMNEGKMDEWMAARRVEFDLLK